MDYPTIFWMRIIAGLMNVFDAGICSSLAQEVIMKGKDDIRFIFKNGFDVRV